MKLFRKIVAIATTMTIAVSMMAANASASYSMAANMDETYSKDYATYTTRLSRININVYQHIFRPAPSAPQYGTFQVSCKYEAPNILYNTKWTLSGELIVGPDNREVTVDDTKTSKEYSYTYSLSGTSVSSYDLTLSTSSEQYGSAKFRFYDKIIEDNNAHNL